MTCPVVHSCILIFSQMLKYYSNWDSVLLLKFKNTSLFFLYLFLVVVEMMI